MISSYHLIGKLQVMIDTNKFTACSLKDPARFFLGISRVLRMTLSVILSVKCGIHFSRSSGKSVLCVSVF